ncbi:MAG: tRNA (guanosine(18)-2'-O)-methyltransferase TrmH [Gemmatimonadota bacterium]|nr:tRNA (guanosine(18)-2'-O)-methyltransferase TrmH [Gemmatimonadota bacterium]
MNPERFRRLSLALERRQPDLTVLMERVHKSHNLSAILRNCDAVGVLEAHAVLPSDGLDIHAHTSAGTAKWVRVRRHVSTEEAVETLRNRGFHILAAHPEAEAIDFRNVDFTKPTALMMGAELLGLSDEALKLADERISIPMVGMAQSFNVSVATALLLFEAFRQRDAAGMYRSSRLDPEEFERILFEWAYPRIARHLRARGTPYPTITPDGNIGRISLI